MSEYRVCPYCGEVIMAEAKKCKHCREWLTDQPVNAISKNHGHQLNQNDRRLDAKSSIQKQSVYSSPQQPVVNVYNVTPSVQKPMKERNGLGLTGFILALLSLVVSWAPGVNIAMWVLGLVFSAIGVFKKPKGFAVAGLVLSIISIVIIVMLFVVLGAIIEEFLTELGM